MAAAAVVGLSILAWESAATVRADVKCTGSQGRNPSAPEFYQRQYNLSVAESLRKDLTLYHSAIASDDLNEIGFQAGKLYSEITANVDLFSDQTPFGCYDSSVLASLDQATRALAPILDDISSASVNFGGMNPSDIPALRR